MNDPTNWNVDPAVQSFAFASPEDAQKAEEVMNRALKESFENGRNVALEEAARFFEADDTQRFGYLADHAEIIKQLRSMKRDDAASDQQESK